MTKKKYRGNYAQSTNSLDRAAGGRERLTQLFLLVVILIYSASGSLAQQGSQSFLFYNVENLFHPSDDSIPGDDNFTPGGTRGWSYYRYHRKLNYLAKTILASNGWLPPSLIAFCEIENRQVLEDLANHLLLMKYHYSCIHRESPDHRGIDTGILYRTDCLEHTRTEWIAIIELNGEVQATREILCAYFTSGKDSLIVCVNHWSSKYGGNLESESKRMNQARHLARYLDSVQQVNPGAIIIAGGDFNTDSNSPPLEFLTGNTRLKEVVDPIGKSSYKYQGRWESIDHVFVGGALLETKCKLRILDFEWLLEADEQYTGQKPWRSYSGYRYHGGISDHLPLLLEFSPGIQ